MMEYRDPEAISRLEEDAITYAKLAVEADEKGLRSLAIQYYCKAVESLSRLLELETSPSLRKIYSKKIREYKSRLNYLRGCVASDVRDPNIYYYAISTKPNSLNSLNKDSMVELTPPAWLKPFKSSITWDDIVDLEHVKRIIRQVIVYPVKRPDLFPLGWPRGILFYGPPGCGKTSVAAAVSSEIDAEFYPIDASMILSKWLGEGEKRVAEMFRFLRSRASKGKPVILFIDEVDSLIGVRSNEIGGEVRVRNQFLKEMDGLQDKDMGKIPLFVIASTNKPWQLDPAFIRRFQKRIYIPLPDYQTRIKLFKYFLSKLNTTPDIDYDLLASKTEGYTASDIRDICQSAQLEVVSEFFESGLANELNSKPRPITMNDLLEALKRIRPSVSREALSAYIVWSQKYQAL